MIPSFMNRLRVASVLGGVIGFALVSAPSQADTGKTGSRCGQFRNHYAPIYEGSVPLTPSYAVVYRARSRYGRGSSTPSCLQGLSASRSFLAKVVSIPGYCRKRHCEDRTPSGWSCSIGSPGDYYNSVLMARCFRGKYLFRTYSAQHD
jgi:hypothetical protein